jgi:hypothetical protein
MKISIKKIHKESALPIGRHRVKITCITESIDEDRNESFFSCRFENSKGHIISRLNNTEQGLVQILKLFNSCGFHFDDNPSNNFTVDTNDLLHKELEINVADQIFTDGLTDEYIEIRVITEFYRIMTEAEIEADDDLPF